MAVAIAPAGALTNPRAERVRSVRRLADRSARLRAGAFLAEGPQAVREALAQAVQDRRAGRAVRVREVYLTAAAWSRRPELAAAAADADVPVLACSEDVLSAMADTGTPQGVVAVCALPAVPVQEALSAGSRLVAVLAQVSDPGNAGTVLRTADAAGASAVVLTPGSTDAHGPKCVRSAAGSTFHLDVAEGVPLSDAVEAARRAGMVVLAAHGARRRGGPPVSDLDDLLDAAAAGAGPLAGPAAWVFGNEAHGLREAELDLADHVVAVPLHGRAESLNLAAAAAVCLYASARGQRVAARGHGRAAR